MTTSQQKLINILLVLMLTFYLFFIYELRGPHWILFPQDLSYVYLYNGVNLLQGEKVGTLIHPALTQIIFSSFIAFVTDYLVSNQTYPVNIILMLLLNSRS